MPPKKKDKAKPEEVVIEIPDTQWETDLIANSVNDDAWSCVVGIIVETMQNYALYVQALDDVLERGNRRVMKGISRSYMLQVSREMCALKGRASVVGKEKKKEKSGKGTKDDKAQKVQSLELPQYFQICAEITKFLNADKTIPLPMEAEFIKFRLLWLKRENQKWRTEEEEKRKQGILTALRAESLKMEESGKGKKEDKEKEESGKSKKQDKGNKKGNKMDKDKGDKKEKERKQSHVSYIDDSPKKGPQLYVLLHGFYDPKLIPELIAIGVPIVCMIRIQIDEENIILAPPLVPSTTDTLGASDKSKVKEKGSNKDKSEHSVRDFQNKAIILSNFWKEWEQLVMQETYKEACKDVINIKCIPPEEENPQLMKEMMYDRVSHLMYSMYDVQRQHHHYRNRMQVVKVDLNAPIGLDEIKTYMELNDSTPSECVTIAFILHAMVEQVVQMVGAEEDAEATVEDKEPRCSTDEDTSSTVSIGKTRGRKSKETCTVTSQQCTCSIPEVQVNHHEENRCSGNFNSANITAVKELGREEDAHKLSERSVQTSKENREDSEMQFQNYYDVDRSLVIKYGDTAKLKIYHQKGILFDVAAATLHILQFCPVPQLWKLFPPEPPGSKLLYNYHMQKLCNSIGHQRIARDDLSYILHLLLFEKMGTILDEMAKSQIQCNQKTDSVKSSIHSSEDEIQSHMLSEELASVAAISTSRDLLPSVVEMPESHPPAATSKLRLSALIGDQLTWPSEQLTNLEQMFLRYYKTVECFRAKKLRGVLDCPSIGNLMDFVNKILDRECSDFSFLRTMERYEYFEEHEGGTMLQVLQRAFETFRDVDFVFYPPTDSLLLCFHDAFDENRTCKDSWDCSIRTPVGLRDFYDYVCSEEREWLQKEEENYQKQLQREEEMQESPSQTEHIEEEVSKVTTPLPEGIIVKAKEAGRPSELRVENTDGKDPPTERTAPEDQLPEVQSEPFEFVGYDIGSSKMNITGSMDQFFSQDGTTCRSQLLRFLNGDMTLSIMIKKMQNTLYFHSFVDKEGKGYIINPLMFHVMLKNDILAVFSKCEVKIAKADNRRSSFFEQRKQSFTQERSSLKSQSLRGSRNVMEAQVKPLFSYNLKLTLPTGLCIETVMDPKYINPFCIKQQYLSEGHSSKTTQDITCQYYLQNGRVVQFRSDGSVLVLCPDGTIYKCLKFKKSEPTPAPPPPSPPPPAEPKPEEKSKGQAKKDKGQKMKKTDKMEPPGKKRYSVKSEEATVPEVINVQPQENLDLPLDVSEYIKIHPDGVREKVIGHTSEEIVPYMVRTAVDLEACELVIKRGDGTYMLITSENILITCFPDGTRITSSLTVTEDVVLFKEERGRSCDYTVENNTRVDGNEEAKLNEEEKILEEIESTNDGERKEDKSENEQRRGSRRSTCSKVNVETDESFVVVHLNYLIEHPNYASVHYEEESKTAEILLPQNVKVIVKPTGTYCIHSDADTDINVEQYGVTFSARVCKCNSVSTSVLEFSNYIPGMTQDNLCKNIDVWNNVFSISCNGTTNMQAGNSCTCKINEYSCCLDRVCVNYLPPVQRRFFVVKRDLSGVEILHVNEIEDFFHLCKQNENLFFETNSYEKDPNKLYHTVMFPLSKDESERWHCDYQMKYPSPKNLYRCDLIVNKDDSFSWLVPHPLKSAGIPQERKIKHEDLQTNFAPKAYMIRIISNPNIINYELFDAIKFGWRRYLKEIVDIYRSYLKGQPHDKRSPEEKSKASVVFDKGMKAYLSENINI